MSLPFSSGDRDTALAGGLIASPAWAGWLDQVNAVLTTASLLVGLALGAARLWRLYRDRRRPGDPSG